MPLATKTALAFIALTSAVVGVWAAVFPVEFYGAFPGCGRTWISLDGPYNEHLVRDVGAASLMMAVLAGIGLTLPRLATPFAIGLSTLFFNLPHLLYHLTKLGPLEPIDRIGNVAVLSIAVLASIWLMTPRAQGAR